MFLVPIIPGTLPLLPQPQRVIGAGGATVRSPPGRVPRAAGQQLTTDAHGASHAHDGHTHRPAQPSARRYLSSSLDMETARWKRQIGRRGGGRTAATRWGSGRQGNRRNLRQVFFFGWGTNRRMELQSVKMRTALLPCLKARVHSLAAIQ